MANSDHRLGELIIDDLQCLSLSFNHPKIANLSTNHAEIRLKSYIDKASALDFSAEIRQDLILSKCIHNRQSVTLPAGKEYIDLIENIIICCSEASEGELLSLSDTSLPEESLHFYRLIDREAEDIEIFPEDSAQDGVIGSLHWELPTREFDQLWENLIYDNNVKNELLSYVYALLRMSERGANFTILRVNRLVLLHGPPGSGKTSLCKALAQKLSIHLNRKYRRTHFLEINSHSLFSKWFSESGKLVQKMFAQIEELIEDKEALVFVLIDEVESLTMARSGFLSRNEPTDAIRAVNAVLTQIDRIRRHSNVLVLTTSNISESLDEAFIDRADITRFVDRPSANAIYSIFCSCIREMQRIGIVEKDGYFDSYSDASLELDCYSTELMQLSRKAKGLSGRSLRQIPIIAYSKLSMEQLRIDQFLKTLGETIDERLSGC